MNINKINYNLLLPIGFFLILSAILASLWYISSKRQDVWIQDQTQKMGLFTLGEFQNIIKDDIGRLENLKKRLENTDGAYFNNWKSDATQLAVQNNSFLFLEWIDHDMIIREATPDHIAEKIVNLDISQFEYRKDEWLRHSKNNSINLTPWILLEQGEYAFLVDVPVYFQDKFQGTITAGMDFNKRFSNYSLYLDDYAIELRDSEGSLFYSLNGEDNARPKERFIFKSPILVDTLDNQNWSFKIYPNKNLISTERTKFVHLSLILGFILSFFLSLVIYFFMLSKRENKRALRMNMALQDSNRVLKAARKKAEIASQAKTDFLSNISHEIRTPLHAIFGFIQLLKNSDLDETDSSYVELMEESSTNLIAIVNGVLDIDKIESGTVKLEEVHFNPSLKLKNLLKVCQNQFDSKGLYLKSNIESFTGDYVIGDKNKFIQIINNILRNALKFTNEGGVVVHYSEVEVHDVVKVFIKIEDSGVGIPESKLDTIFERFTQLESSFKKQYKGSGLGLAISKQLVSYLRGKITVESQVNKGSTFIVQCEFDLAADQHNIDIYNSYSGTDFSKLKVLVADDNNINVLVLKKLLEAIHIQVEVAVNGKIAFEKTLTNTYDLVLMDIHMPVMDGFQATTLIRQKHKDIVIIGLSANVTSEAIIKALDAGMNNYITKPFPKERLYNMIMMYFGSNYSK